MTTEFKSCLICKEGDVDPDNQYRMVLTNKTDWDHFIRQCKEKLEMDEINSLILALGMFIKRILFLDGSFVKQLHDIPNHSIVWCSSIFINIIQLYYSKNSTKRRRSSSINL